MSQAIAGNGNGKLSSLTVQLPDTAEVPQASVTLKDFPTHFPLKWSWSCRNLDRQFNYQVDSAGEPPAPGDVVMVQVQKNGFHSRLMTCDHERLRIYAGDVLVGVFGNRYATDAYEAEVQGKDNLNLLTGAGMIGTVRTKHENIKPPTKLKFLGHLCDADGCRVNLKQQQFHPQRCDPGVDNVVLAVGTSMNSGKTTVAAKLVKALLRRGHRVATFKITGSVSQRDLQELRATGAHHVCDFSDYGFPSTYLTEREELLELFDTMLADAAGVAPDLVVIEIADGVLQRETRMLLDDPAIRRRVRGVVLSAGCALSALRGIEEIEKFDHQVAAVSGLITNSPLFMRELAGQSPVRIGSSADDGDQLADLVAQHCHIG